MMSKLELFLMALALCSFGMIATWFIARKLDNYSIVDLAWTLEFPIITALFAGFASGWEIRRLLLLGVVGLWGLRLAFHLASRIFSTPHQEDGRYLTLRQNYAPHIEKGFFWFFQIQALSVALLSTPFLLISFNGKTQFGNAEIIGTVAVFLSLVGEMMADQQLKKFKADPSHRGLVCNIGLWKYSRHPNYFFECCIWWGFFLVSLGSTHGLFTVYCPLLMTFLLLKVTGVPLAEAQSLKSRGDQYRQYQKVTSCFVPWFPKKTG